MAVYYLQTKAISRASGRGAPGAAAYRAGERIRDERTGRLHDYSGRTDVRHAEIIVPAALEASAPDWVRQRAALWNGAEAVERRRDSRVAREYQVALPAELGAAQRLELARAFSRELAERYRVAVDLTVHDPRREGDSRNFHAHLLTTTRELNATGLGAKAQSEWSGTQRFQHGLSTNRAELVAIRERWAALANEALRAANLNLRIDHRSLAAQGIDREPVPRIPYAAVQMERRGMRSEVAERIRAQYRERVMARERATATPVASLPGTPLQELQRRGREAWLQIRRNAQLGVDAAQPGASIAAASRLEATRSTEQDRDFSL